MTNVVYVYRHYVCDNIYTDDLMKMLEDMWKQEEQEEDNKKE